MLLVLETNFGLCYSKEIDVFERARQGEPAQVRTENANPRNIQEFNELKYKSKNSHWNLHTILVCVYLHIEVTIHVTVIFTGIHS